jgi:D-alanyl-D-alanine carboxypeptidase
VIQSGDTLGSIAAKYNTTVDELMTLNPGSTEHAPARRAHTRRLALRFVRLCLLAVAAAALVFATPAFAGPPAVSARAYFVVNPSTGEVLAQKRAWARVPIASITKLMTVLVALDHAKWNDVVRVRAEGCGRRRVDDQPPRGERITVGDLVKGALIQSANDAADGARRLRGTRVTSTRSSR